MSSCKHSLRASRHSQMRHFIWLWLKTWYPLFGPLHGNKDQDLRSLLFLSSYLGCYWIGSLDFRFLVEIKLGLFSTKPPKSGPLVAGGSLQQPRYREQLAFQAANVCASLSRVVNQRSRLGERVGRHTHVGSSGPLFGHVAVVVKNPILGGGFRCTTHFRTYFSGDWDVHWGYGLVAHGHVSKMGQPPDS